MAILAGIDEAGLGPRLGPLVVGLTVFRGPREVLERLPTVLQPTVGPTARARIPVGDSKRLYGGGKTLAALERGLFPFLRQYLDGLPGDLIEWLNVLDLPGGRAAERARACPWYRERLPLPRATAVAAVEEAAAELQPILARAGVGLVEVRLGVWPAPDVNRELDRYASKNIFNFHAAAPFLKHVFEVHAETEDVELVVDRQGGRKDYLALLRQLFYPAAVSPRSGPKGAFAYSVRDDRRRLGVRFVTRADSTFLPVGLASMAAKYTRELHMTLFNRFWRGLKPDLKPTAGYPADAIRFLEEIDEERREAGIVMEQLVRSR